MKREAATHPKLYDLADRLEIPHAHALGLLQGLIWFTADHATAGDIGKWPDGAISRGSGWGGDSAHFIEALVASGWLDRNDDHRLVMHDWPDHTESWVRAKLARLGQAFLACYQVPAEATAEAIPEATAEATAEPPGETAEATAEPAPEAIPERNTNRTEPNRTKPNQTKPKKGAAAGPPDLGLHPSLAANDDFRAAWAEWWKYRGGRKLTRNATTMQAQLAALAAVGPAAAVDAIQTAIRSGWQGVFPEKTGAARGKTTTRHRAQRHGTT